MKELVIISGKGGTGKTSIAASFAALADGQVLADCDVDAADLHLILEPKVLHRQTFKAGKEAIIRQDDCVGCGACLDNCRFEAVIRNGDAAGEATFTIDPISCEGCGVCVEVCPVDAIDFNEKTCGEWYISETPHGPMVHARLGIAEENSGKLVTIVRNHAKRIAKDKGLEWVIIDGSPGIGCPVIASIVGASLVLVVTEPSLSGIHDLKRVVTLTDHFNIPAMVCINKCDINPEMTAHIENLCAEKTIETAGRIPYDTAFTAAQLERKSIVEISDGPAARAVRRVWNQINRILQATKEQSAHTQ